MGIFRFFVCLFLLLLSSASFAVDTDNDGLPDTWEDANGLNPVDVSDAQSDSTSNRSLVTLGSIGACSLQEQYPGIFVGVMMVTD